MWRSIRSSMGFAHCVQTLLTLLFDNFYNLVSEGGAVCARYQGQLSFTHLIIHLL